MAQWGSITVDDEALRQICQQHHVHALYLFGSAARNTMRADSDIDLIVAFDSGVRIGLFTVGALQMDLQDLTGRSVDVVTEGGLQRTAWYQSALRERRPIYVH